MGRERGINYTYRKRALQLAFQYSSKGKKKTGQRAMVRINSTRLAFKNFKRSTPFALRFTHLGYDKKSTLHINHRETISQFSEEQGSPSQRCPAIKKRGIQKYRVSFDCAKQRDLDVTSVPERSLFGGKAHLLQMMLQTYRDWGFSSLTDLGRRLLNTFIIFSSTEASLWKKKK
jgi:hypothetical protein